MRDGTIAMLLTLLLVPGCASLLGTKDKCVYVELGEQGAGLSIHGGPYVEMTIEGPGTYHSVPKGAQGCTPAQPSSASEPPVE